jgi:hypothetical protein
VFAPPMPARSGEAGGAQRTELGEFLYDAALFLVKCFASENPPCPRLEKGENLHLLEYE